jgi:ribosomal protein L11 methyltransferase
MAYLNLCFELGSLGPEAAEQACFDCGALSVTFCDSRDDAVLEPAVGEVRLWPATRVQALFPATPAAPALLQQLALALSLPMAALGVQSLADRVWEREWLRDFHALRFGRRLWVRPSHERVDAPDAVVVELDPGLAFGTGTHASTALCLEWLDALPARPGRVIDYGCGSGILGIAAARLGAQEVQAFDIDPQALLATQENAQRNAVDATVKVVDLASDLRGGADLLLANILAGTLIELAAELCSLLRPGGRYVLAGILGEQEQDVAAAFMAGSRDVRRFASRGEWVALCGTRASGESC